MLLRSPHRLRPGFRTRFAPAPTGKLHLGHAVNAVWVWGLARAFDGRVVLRIEDHDRARCRALFEQGILDDLDWLGLSPDEGDTASFRTGTPNPLRQRDRDAAYGAVLDRLLAAGLAYPCACSRRDIAALVPHAPDEEPRYPGRCRHANHDPTLVTARRVTLDRMEIAFDDLRLGEQRQCPADQCGDLLVRDRRGQWTYQFAVVVDDLAQEIDLIIRGEDLLASTGRQRQLGSLLGATRFPDVLHHGLIRHPDGRKLSKSLGDTALAELRAAGWSPAQLLGHAAWLAGWQPTDRTIGAVDLAALWMDAR